MIATARKQTAAATIKCTIDPVFVSAGIGSGWGLHLHIKPGQSETPWDARNVNGMFLAFNDMGYALANVAILNESRAYDRKPLLEIVPSV